MPAASSKPTSQNLETEVQDPVKLLIGALEKKARNLEKRKTKLEGYKEMVANGKSLNKDQQEAVSHFEEVQGNLSFAREFLVTIQAVVNETSKAKKKQERRDLLMRQENEQRRLRNVLLLQNILNQMGQDHIRNDFLAGTNGAEKLEEQDLTFLDEFYPVVSPSREDEEEETAEEGKETTEEENKKSFDDKMSEAAVHLDKFLKSDESEICGTTYKYLHELVQRIHNCGYLDNIPDPPAEEVVEPAVVPDEQFEEEEQEDSENVEVEEEYRPPSVTSPGIPVAPPPEVVNFNQSSQVETIMPQQGSSVSDIPNPPEPIEMPPPKVSQAHDVNEVIAPVEGGVTFFQESMLDVDSPHLDPAVIAVSLMPTQSYMSTSYQSNTDPSPMDRQGTPTHMDQQDALRQQNTDAIYPSQPDPSSYSQNIYEPQQSLMGGAQQPPSLPQHDYTTQQNLQQTQQSMGVPAQQSGMVSQQSGMVAQQGGMVTQQQGLVSQQGYIDQANFASQSTIPSGMGGAQSGMVSAPSQSEYGNTQQQQQQDYGSSTQDYGSSTQQDYGMTTLGAGRQTTGSQIDDGSYNQSAQSQQLSDMRDYRNSPIDPQLSKQEDRRSPSPNIYQQTPLQPSSSQYGSSEITSNDGFGQSLQGSSQLNTEVQSLSSTGGSATPPPSIPFPNAPSPVPQSLAKDDLGDTPQMPKSTMNAAAPPFQSSARASPQMQTLQATGTEDSSFSSASTTLTSQESSHLQPSKKPDETRTTEYRSSPPNIGAPTDNSFQYNSYNNYQRNNRGNRGGRGGSMGSPGYRNARGAAGMPFIRNPARFNNASMQRGGYNPGYIPQARDSFQQRAPEMGFHPQQATYQAFNRPQDSYYRGRGGVNRGAPRGGRGGNNIRGGQQMQYRARGGYQKPGAPITA